MIDPLIVAEPGAQAGLPSIPLAREEAPIDDGHPGDPTPAQDADPQDTEPPPTPAGALGDAGPPSASSEASGAEGEAASVARTLDNPDSSPSPKWPPAWLPMPSPAMCVYLLADAGRRTYVGATVDLRRRVRQHNGELAGGARRTHGREWTIVAAVTGFFEWRDALRFEHAWRRACRRAGGSGVDWRMRGLNRLMAQERWSSTSPLASTVPLVVHTRPRQTH